MRNPVTSPCYCLMLRRAASSVTDMYDKALAEYGITLNQFSIIINLNNMSMATTTDLAQQIGLERSTLVRNLKAIMAMGYIENVSGENERNNHLRVTSSGRHLLKLTIPVWQSVQDKISESLGRENTALLMDMLYKLQETE